MLRTPRSLKLHATAAPTGDTVRFSGDGKLRICSTEKDRDGDCAAALIVRTAAIRAIREVLMGTPLGKYFTPHAAVRATFYQFGIGKMTRCYTPLIVEGLLSWR